MLIFPRPYWRCYYSNTDAIIYVVDSVDRERIGISKSELVAMLEVSNFRIFFKIFVLFKIFVYLLWARK